jgi:dihydroorotate dehydrogenase (NAD+) catalytic subunit
MIDERRGSQKTLATRAGIENGITAGRTWYGRMYGPAAKPLMMRAVVEIAALKLHVPIVACGGIESAEDAREFLAAGACAVEIDSACWFDPGLASRIAADLGGEA